MTPGAPVQIGMIGAGNFARQQHLPNLARTPECRLRTVCDVLPDVARQAAEQFGADHAQTDYRHVLDDPAIDAVVVAVRDDLQATIAIEAMQAGKHVYVEKPLAKDPQLCQQVARTQQQTSRRLAVGFNRRYAPIYRDVRRIVADDAGPRNVHIRMADDAWRWAKNYPPGYLLTLDMGHLFDLMRWLSGAEIESVYCISSRPDDDAMLLRMSDGCTVSILFSAHGTMDMPKERTEIITHRGGVWADDFVELRTYGYPQHPHVTMFPGHSHPDGEFAHKYLFEHLGAAGLGALRRMTWQLRQRIEAGLDDNEPDAAEIRRYVARTLPNFLRDQGWHAAIRAFVVGIATGEPTDHATADDAVAAARASEAAVRSRQSGQVVRVDPV